MSGIKRKIKAQSCTFKKKSLWRYRGRRQRKKAGCSVGRSLMCEEGTVEWRGEARREPSWPALILTA